MPILSPQQAVSALEASRATPSDELEQEVLLLIASGYTYGEIAARLQLSISAIEAHVASALRHLGVVQSS